MPVIKNKYYFLKRPTGKSRSYKLVLKTRYADTAKTKNETVACEELDLISYDLINGKLSRSKADALAQDVLDKHKDKLAKIDGKMVWNQDNLKILDDLWDEDYEYRDYKHEESKRSVYNDFKRAVGLLGELSLKTATDKEIMKAVNKACKGKPDKQRRMVGKLNVIMKDLDRTEIKLKRAKKRSKDVKYLTLDEFRLVTEVIEDQIIRDVCWIAFGSGMRVGEIFALPLNTVGPKSIRVEKQLHRQNVINKEPDLQKSKGYGPVKNERIRDTLIIPNIPEVKRALKRFVELDKATILDYREYRWSDFQYYCTEVESLNENPNKRLTFHDIRHCYVIHLLHQGVSLSIIARYIGDSLAVAEEHYAGFISNEDDIEAGLRVLNKK